MPVPTVTSLPTAPSRSDAPAQFSSRADAWVAAIDTFTDEINALAAYLGSTTATSGPIDETNLTMATARLLGRTTASEGGIEEIAMGLGLDLSSGTLAIKGGNNTQTGSSYTLVLTDAFKLVAMNNASANTLTVPPNSSVAFPIGTRIDVGQYGAGACTITPGSGVTIRAKDSALKTNGQYSGATIQKIGTNEWWAFGDLTS